MIVTLEKMSGMDSLQTFYQAEKEGRLSQWRNRMCEEENAICGMCNGSGEGMYSDSTCRYCKGKGEYQSMKEDEEYSYKEDEYRDREYG